MAAVRSKAVVLLLLIFFIVTPIVGVCNCCMFCCTLLYVHFSIATILIGKRELVVLLNSFFWCLLMVERLFPAVPRGCLRFVIVVFSDNTHLLFFSFLLCLYSERRTVILIKTQTVRVHLRCIELRSKCICMNAYVCILLLCANHLRIN